MSAQTYHRTQKIEKHLQASPQRVYDAWADANKRAQWSGPSSEIEIKMEQDDFTPGGRDISLCIAGGEVMAKVLADYHDIVPEQRIVFTETIMAAEAVQGVSLVSALFEPDGEGTKLTVTLQTAALDDGSILDEVAMGWEAALLNLQGIVAEPV